MKQALSSHGGLSRRRLTIAGTVTALVVLTALFVGPRVASSSTNAPKVQTSLVQRGSLVATVSAAGNISTLQQASLSFQENGRVSAVNVQVGDQVKQGQVLMSLDTSDLQLALKTAQANVASAQASLDDATAKNASNPEQLIAAKAAVDKAQAAVAQAQSAYDRIGGASNPQIGMTSQALTLQQDTIDYQSALSSYQIAAAGINDTAVKTAQAALQVAQIAQEQAQSNLTKANVVAPFDGQVAAVNFHVGDTAGSGSTGSSTTTAGAVGGGQTAVTIVNVATLQVDATLSEIDIVKVKQGQMAQLTLDALPGNNYTARVTDIGPVGTVTQGVVNYPVTLNVQNTDGMIKPGMTANLNITVAQDNNVLIVPTRAVHSQGNQKTVTVLFKGQQITTPIQTGLSNDQSVEVVSGLKEGDQVVVAGTTTAQPRAPNFGPGGPGGARRRF